MNTFLRRIAFSISAIFTLSVHTQELQIPEIIGDNFQATDPIVHLLGLTGIRIDKDPSMPDKDWPKAMLTLTSRNATEIKKAINGEIEKNVTWARPPGKKRWECDKLEYLGETTINYQNIIDICLEELHQETAVKPQAPYSYKAILILGSSLPDVFGRVKFLESLKLDTTIPVTLLTGERSLDDKAHETPEQWEKLTGSKEFLNGNESKFPKDEKAMMELVMKHFGYLYQTCYAEKPVGSDRAITCHAVEEWLKTNPEAGNYLAISAQPFVQYQNLVITKVLWQQLGEKANDYTIHTVGNGINYEERSDIAQMPAKLKALSVLDNLARIFREINEIRHLLHV